MSASYVEAAPGPSLPGGYRYGRSSARSSSRRRHSPSKPRIADDAQFATASSDVISNLLASFGSISIPSEDRHLHPALRTGSLRESSPNLQPYHSFSATAAPSPNIEYARSTRHSSITSAIWAPDDATEPNVARTNKSPVIRPAIISRRSSSSHNFSIEPSNSNIVTANIGVGDWSAELIQPDDQLSPLPSDVFTFSGSQTLTPRQSIDLFGSDYGGYSNRSSISHDVKGKGKALEVPENRAPRNHMYDFRRNGAILTPPTPGSRWTSRHSTARSSISAGMSSTADVGPSQPHRRFLSVDQASKDHKATERLKSYQSLEAPAPTVLNSQVDVPPRGSSLRKVDSLTLLRRRGSVRSTVTLTPEAAPLSEAHSLVVEDVTMEDNGEQLEVLNRIKVLKAANEARRRSFKDPATYEYPMSKPAYSYSQPAIWQPPSSAVSLRNAFSTSTLSRQRSAEIFQQDEPRPSTSGQSDASFAVSSTISTLTRLSADILPVEYVNFSRDRPTVVRGASPRRFRASVDSTQSIKGHPGFKRWSQPTPEFRPVEVTPSRDISRKGSPFAKPPIVAERKTSHTVVLDSVSTYLLSPRLSQKIYVASENRTVAFSEVGDPRGHVIFCCVGMGMTRYIMTFYDELATSLKLRLITPDRPGIGDSEPYLDGPRQPTSWPNDVQAICDHLGITRFSLLAHSAGAIYALAVALTMPMNIRGKIHLLAPWIPPSQMVAPHVAGDHTYSNGSSPARVLPRSQRFLRILPTPFLKLSTSSWALNAAFARSKSPPATTKSKSAMDRFRSSSDTNASVPSPRISFGQLRAAISRRPSETTGLPTANIDDVVLSSIPDEDIMLSFHGHGDHSLSSSTTTTERPATSTAPVTSRLSIDSTVVGQRRYDAALTPAIWELATKNANPTVDLLVCLERQQTIGFRYADVDLSSPVERDLRMEQLHSGAYSPTGIGVATGTGYDATADTFSTERLHSGRGGTAIVIHHGSKDARVPLENAKWLASTMKGTEVRVIEGEGHGLMACAGVMSSVLTEMGRELDELEE